MLDNQASEKEISAGLGVKWRFCGEMYGVQQVAKTYMLDNDRNISGKYAGHLKCWHMSSHA